MIFHKSKILNNQKRVIVVLFLAVLCCLIFASCGNSEPQLQATAPQHTYTPEPSHFPRLDVREKIYLNGTEVDCYFDSLSEGTKYVLLRDAMEAIESNYVYDSKLGDGHACERIADILEGKDYSPWNS